MQAHPPHSAPAPPAPEPSHPAPPETERDDKKESFEAAARKVDVDEDYDDEPQDDKRRDGSGGRNSPQRNSLNGSAKAEPEPPLMSVM